MSCALSFQLLSWFSWNYILSACHKHKGYGHKNTYKLLLRRQGRWFGVHHCPTTTPSLSLSSSSSQTPCTFGPATLWTSPALSSRDLRLENASAWTYWSVKRFSFHHAVNQFIWNKLIFKLLTDVLKETHMQTPHSTAKFVNYKPHDPNKNRTRVAEFFV